MNPSDTAAPARQRSAPGTAPLGHAGKPPGTPPAPAAAARSTARNPARPPGAARRASSRRRISRCAGRAAPAPPPRPGSPPAETTGQPPGQRRPPDPRRTSTRPGIVVLDPVRDLPRHGRARAARLFPPLLLLRPLSGPPLLPRRLPPRQVIRTRRHRGVPLFRDPDRFAAASCSRRSATTASSAAIRSACARISASRGSAGGSSGGTSVTARNHPRNHAQPPR